MKIMWIKNTVDEIEFYQQCFLISYDKTEIKYIGEKILVKI